MVWEGFGQQGWRPAKNGCSRNQRHWSFCSRVSKSFWKVSGWREKNPNCSVSPGNLLVQRKHPRELWKCPKALLVYRESDKCAKETHCYVRLTQTCVIHDHFEYRWILIPSLVKAAVSSRHVPQCPLLHPMKQQPANFSASVFKTPAKSFAFNQFQWYRARVAVSGWSQLHV